MLICRLSSRGYQNLGQESFDWSPFHAWTLSAALAFRSTTALSDYVLAMIVSCRVLEPSIARNEGRTEGLRRSGTGSLR